MAKEERLHYMDVLRATAMFLGLVIHAAVPFSFVGMDFFRIHDEPSSLLHHLIHLIHTFRMELFFLVSGFFSLLVSRKRGLAAYAKNRFWRIGVPFVLCVVVLQPLLAAETVLDVVDSNQSLFSQYLSFLTQPGYILDEPMPIGNWFWHFWFLHVLIYFVAIFILVTMVLEKGNIKLRFVSSFFRALGGTGGVLVLTLMTYPILLVSPPFADVPGIGTSLDVLLYYGLFFTVGVLLFSDYKILELLTSGIKYHVIPLVLSLCYLIPLIDELRITTQPEILLQNWSLFTTVDGQKSLIGNYPFMENPFNFSSLHAPSKWHLLCLLRAYTTWCMVFGFIALFKQCMSKQTALGRYMADSSYFIYLIHNPVQLYIAFFLRDRIESSILCFSIVLVGSLVLCVLLYHVTCRSTLLGTLLSGRKYSLSLDEERNDLKNILTKKSFYVCSITLVAALFVADHMESRKEYKLLFYSLHAEPENVDNYVRNNRDKDLSQISWWDGVNALHMASRHMSKPRPEGMISQTVGLLLKHGFDPDGVDQFGLTPLHYAVKKGNKTALNQLLQARANPNISESSHGNTPLHYAAVLGDVSAIKNLVAAGGDPILERSDGANAIELYERFHSAPFPEQ